MVKSSEENGQASVTNTHIYGYSGANLKPQQPIDKKSRQYKTAAHNPLQAVLGFTTELRTYGGNRSPICTLNIKSVSHPPMNILV